jgi:hypothetical protein
LKTKVYLTAGPNPKQGPTTKIDIHWNKRLERAKRITSGPKIDHFSSRIWPNWILRRKFKCFQPPTSANGYWIAGIVFLPAFLIFQELIFFLVCAQSAETSKQTKKRSFGNYPLLHDFLFVITFPSSSSRLFPTQQQMVILWLECLLFPKQ